MRSWRFIPSLVAITALLLALGTVAGAHADDVFLKNGRWIHGEVETLENELRVRVERGWITIPKEQVERVEEKPSPYEIYKSRAGKIADGTAREHFLLGLWCDSRNLRRSARREYQLAVGEDPDHLGARTALGYLRIDGEWYT